MVRSVRVLLLVPSDSYSSSLAYSLPVVGTTPRGRQRLEVRLLVSLCYLFDYLFLGGWGGVYMWGVGGRRGGEMGAEEGWGGGGCNAPWAHFPTEEIRGLTDKFRRHCDCYCFKC